MNPGILAVVLEAWSGCIPAGWGSDLWLSAVVLWNSASHVSTMLRLNLDLPIIRSLIFYILTLKVVLLLALTSLKRVGDLRSGHWSCMWIAPRFGENLPSYWSVLVLVAAGLPRQSRGFLTGWEMLFRWLTRRGTFLHLLVFGRILLGA